MVATPMLSLLFPRHDKLQYVYVVCGDIPYDDLYIFIFISPKKAAKEQKR